MQKSYLIGLKVRIEEIRKEDKKYFKKVLYY